MEYLLPVVNRSNLLITHGKGGYLYCEKGEKYLDFISGIAVNVFGHADEKITEILASQSKEMMHIANYFRTSQLEYAAKRLTELSIGGKAFFLNSGTESVETAIKIARRYFWHKNSDKYEIICFKKSFHGRTIASIAAQGNAKYLEGFEPRLQGFLHADLNDINSVKNLISSKTAAIMLEPIQGEGGVMACTQEFLAQIRNICDENDILLILDEVQSGVGRTGTLYAFEQFGIKPDILITAKGLAAGYPVGACVASNKVAPCMTPGSHGSTFGCNPMAAKLVGYVLDEVSKPKFLENVKTASEKIIQAVNKIQEKTDLITEIRGKGLLLGIKINEKITNQDFVLKARENHLLLAPSSADNIIRLLPRLNITDDEIADFGEKLQKTCDFY
ncbi:aspartate aminotransferase family protein [Candidatus Deianiraea vastatrix]|uniref:Acetylornithine/succinyldiaminopimelate aminotransferase n=1 Tax=Candidatus Deianiraea vastatrix TaxID=2163644 RepID=A0A5B8XC58_9RICK|nr:aspartate aminotransferase family protein [Candidatus Deianiraea vastatrix]QED22850.1 Acetylornithine/succinyldiaminopimelate aminotransferase [Candidatus Deianiraea vastatrix]